MMRKLLIAFGLAALSLPVGGVYAASNPSGTGQPNQTCQVINASATNPTGATGPFYPGNAESAQGSVFAEPGGVFTNGGTGARNTTLSAHPRSTTSPVTRCPRSLRSRSVRGLEGPPR